MTTTPSAEALADEIKSLADEYAEASAADARHYAPGRKAAARVNLYVEIDRLASSGQAATAVPLPRLSGAFRTTVADGDRYTMVFQFQTLADLQAADQEWLDAKHIRPEVAAMGGQQPEESARAGTDIGQPVLESGPALCTPSEAAELAGRFKLPVRFELGTEALREDCERLARLIDHVRASPTQPASAPAREGKVALPDGWVPLIVEWEKGYPEEVAYGPQRMMDRLKKWLDKHFANALAASATPAAPAQPREVQVQADELVSEAKAIMEAMLPKMDVHLDRNAEIAAFTFWKLKAAGEKPWMQPLEALSTPPAPRAPSIEPQEAVRK